MLYQYGVNPAEHEHELMVQGNGDNVQYIRLLVPKNSAIIGAAKEIESTMKLDISHLEYDEISFTTRVIVGETKQVWVDYSSQPKNCTRSFDFITQP